jgi:hypothetical protein
MIEQAQQCGSHQTATVKGVRITESGRGQHGEQHPSSARRGQQPPYPGTPLGEVEQFAPPRRRKSSSGQPGPGSTGGNARVHQSLRGTFSFRRGLISGRGTIGSQILHRGAGGGEQLGHVGTQRTHRPGERAGPDRAAGPNPRRTEQTPDLHALIWRQVDAQRAAVQPVARFQTAPRDRQDLPRSRQLCPGEKRVVHLQRREQRVVIGWAHWCRKVPEVGGIRREDVGEFVAAPHGELE